ncbi:MAG TPA: hypothetical protein GX390_01625 [Acholeplasmataceae bacterium]|jgi:predicted RNA-binding protein (virulence factor B family)|nr:hypothetical protein [Acholeplasmataceae bacterium]
MENLGTIKKYHVAKETPLGYMITNGKDEYFLHRAETNYQAIIPGDTVSAFIYLDKKDRPTATLHAPKITIDTAAFVTVVSVMKSAGVFVDIGISKDIFLSKDDLPKDESAWPKPGDRLMCRLRVKAGRLLARPLVIEEIPPGKGELATEAEGYVIRYYKEGVLLLTESGDIISVITGPRAGFRVGKKLTVRITERTERGYKGMLIEKFTDKDKEEILAYLRAHHGLMTITDESGPEVIFKHFGISKKAFKTALGRLYKEKRIEILPGKIILIE